MINIYIAGHTAGVDVILKSARETPEALKVFWAAIIELMHYEGQSWGLEHLFVSTMP